MGFQFPFVFIPHEISCNKEARKQYCSTQGNLHSCFQFILLFFLSCFVKRNDFVAKRTFPWCFRKVPLCKLKLLWIFCEMLWKSDPKRIQHFEKSWFATKENQNVIFHDQSQFPQFQIILGLRASAAQYQGIVWRHHITKLYYGIIWWNDIHYGSTVQKHITEICHSSYITADIWWQTNCGSFLPTSNFAPKHKYIQEFAPFPVQTHTKNTSPLFL